MARFQPPPSERSVHLSAYSALQWLRPERPVIGATMDGAMTGPTDHQGLPRSLRHAFDPGRYLPFPAPLQIGQPANVVDLHVLGGPTQFAGVRQQPLEQLRPATGSAREGGSVVEAGPRLPPQGQTTELRHQGTF